MFCMRELFACEGFSLRLVACVNKYALRSVIQLHSNFERSDSSADRLFPALLLLVMPLILLVIPGSLPILLLFQPFGLCKRRLKSVNILHG